MAWEARRDPKPEGWGTQGLGTLGAAGADVRGAVVERGAEYGGVLSGHGA